MPKTLTNPRPRGLIFGGKQRVSAHISDYTVTLGESGTLFTTEGASGTVEFTLPAATKGAWFEFFAAEDFNLVVKAASAISVVFNNVAATSLTWSTAGEKIGGGCKAWSDGSKWFLVELIHEAVTVTVA